MNEHSPSPWSWVTVSLVYQSRLFVRGVPGLPVTETTWSTNTHYSGYTTLLFIIGSHSNHRWIIILLHTRIILQTNIQGDPGTPDLLGLGPEFGATDINYVRASERGTFSEPSIPSRPYRPMRDRPNRASLSGLRYDRVLAEFTRSAHLRGVGP